MVEMPALSPPFYGINVADVRREHYDAIYANIEQQAQGAAALFGARLHLFSVTDYGDIRRVLFIFYFATMPDSLSEFIPGLAAGEFPDIWTGSELWEEFTRLAEGYTWWLTPALSAAEVPSAAL